MICVNPDVQLCLQADILEQIVSLLLLLGGGCYDIEGGGIWSGVFRAALVAYDLTQLLEKGLEAVDLGSVVESL